MKLFEQNLSFFETPGVHTIYPIAVKVYTHKKKTINYVHWVPYGNLIQCIRRCRFYKFVILSMWAYVCVFYLSPNTHNICKSASSRCTIEMCNVSLAHIKLIHAALVFRFIQTERFFINLHTACIVCEDLIFVYALCVTYTIKGCVMILSWELRVLWANAQLPSELFSICIFAGNSIYYLTFFYYSCQIKKHLKINYQKYTSSLNYIDAVNVLKTKPSRKCKYNRLW